MNKYLPIGVVAILVIGGGWWYFNQSNVPVTSEVTLLPVEQQNTNTSAATTKTRPTTGATTETYVNSEYGISFSHPDNWQCRTTQSQGRVLHQTSCDDDGKYEGDSLANVIVFTEPWPAGGDDYTEISRTSLTGQNSSVFSVEVYKSDLYPSIGSVAYKFTAPAGKKSYTLSASYGTGKPYATAEDVRKALDPIAQSLVVK